MFSTKGRGRALTDEQIRRILEWQRARKTLTQVAREYGVSRATVENVIRTRGEYKHRAPRASSQTRAGRVQTKP